MKNLLFLVIYGMLELFRAKTPEFKKFWNSGSV